MQTAEKGVRKTSVDRSAQIHPTASVCNGVVIGAGTVIEAGAVIQSGVAIGANCHIAANSVLSHCDISSLGFIFLLPFNTPRDASSLAAS